ncbi:hypothetical protein TWF696_006358 [Orbilia brochopaga]|uniref:SMP domain-containing protein n=1 Tax=Orbilia brochopaga TaxID=3140254 RepID=A0AAV9UYS8_9PEZI
MAARLPTQEELARQAEKGILFTAQQVADIAQKESERNGSGIAPGGPAATAQSFYDKQQHFLEKASEIVEKPPAAITKEDASEIQSLEAKALGGVRPSKGSLSSVRTQGRSTQQKLDPVFNYKLTCTKMHSKAIQSIADHNVAEAKTTELKEIPPNITKETAAKAQHDEAVTHGGVISKGSVAAQMQSIADKTEHLKETMTEAVRKREANE